MKIKNSLRAGILLLVLGLLVTAYAPASAATGNGYQVSPVRTDLTMSAGETKAVTVYIKNVSPASVQLRVFANDFRARDETGSPALLLDGGNYPKYGLKRYMSVPKDSIELKAGEQKAVSVQIKIPQNVKAGGYFGAVRFGAVDTDDPANRTVNLSANVASLVLVKVPGNVHEQMVVTGFGAENSGGSRRIFTSPKDIKAVVRFENIGDLQEEPFGKITLKKGQAVINTYEINNTTPKGNVLPGSTRKFTVPLEGVGSFGKYRLEGNFGYGDKGQLLTSAATFYVIPLALIVAVLAVVAIIAGLVAWRLRGKRFPRR